MNSDPSISILGAGWLGKAFADTLRTHYKGQIYLSSTSQDKVNQLKNEGYEAFQLNLNPQPEGKFDDWQQFLASDYLLLNIPPQTRQKGYAFHPQQIQHLLNILPKSCQVIFISSTSVYPNVDDWVQEDLQFTQSEAENPAIWQAERLLETALGEGLNILRCGGLMGYNRIPGRYFAGKKNLETGNIPVNFIHRDDVIGIILHLIRHPEVKGEIFNVVTAEHPIRQIVYEHNAEKFGFESPTFKDVPPKNYKVISNEKLLRHLDYQFKYPNPLDFVY